MQSPSLRHHTSGMTNAGCAMSACNNSHRWSSTAQVPWHLRQSAACHDSCWSMPPRPYGLRTSTAKLVGHPLAPKSTRVLQRQPSVQLQRQLQCGLASSLRHSAPCADGHCEVSAQKPLTLSSKRTCRGSQACPPQASPCRLAVSSPVGWPSCS